MILASGEITIVPIECALLGRDEEWAYLRCGGSLFLLVRSARILLLSTDDHSHALGDSGHHITMLCSRFDHICTARTWQLRLMIDA